MRGTLGVLAAIAITSGGLAFGHTVQDGRTNPSPAAPAAALREKALVEVRTHLNRTAVWVGDQIVWTVDVICAPTVDVIADDLVGEKLALTGLELLGSDTERITNPDGTLTHRVRYRLSAYEVSEAQVTVGPFKVRYYERRPGQRAEDVAAAGEATVPGAVLAWRSTLPSGLSTIELREERAAEAGPTFLDWARPVGLTLVVMSAAPVLLWIAARVREWRRPRERRPSVRASRKEARSALTTLAAAETSTESERRAAYTRLNDIVRRYVSDSTGVAAMALTPEEVSSRFNGNGTRHTVAALGDILAECERARYGPAEQVPTAERFRDSVQMVERLVQ